MSTKNTNKEELRTILIENVQNQYDSYKERVLKKSKEQIFEEAFGISSRTDLLNYFKNDGILDKEEYMTEKQLKSMVEDKFLLNNLYEEMMKTDTLYSCLWEDIDLIIDNYIQRKEEREG